jgi:hypothetical protein
VVLDKSSEASDAGETACATLVIEKEMIAAARIERASEGYEPSLGPIQIRRIDKAITIQLSKNI